MHQINGQIIQLSFKRIDVKDDYILPTIGFTFSRSSKVVQNSIAKDLSVKNPTTKFSLKIIDYKRHVIGTVSSSKLIYTWDKNGDSEFEFVLTLDSYLST